MSPLLFLFLLKFNPIMPGLFGLVTARGKGGRGGGHKVPPHHNFFVIGRIVMKFGKLVTCYTPYLLVWLLVG